MGKDSGVGAGGGNPLCVPDPVFTDRGFPRVWTRNSAFPRFDLEPWNVILGILMTVGGFYYAFSTVLSQFSRARGTPLPVMATQKLLVDGVYLHCRNPMVFGTLLAYLGIAIVVGSISSILAVLIFGGLLLTYVKKVEERELEARFGQEYVDYKARTPFLIPGNFRRKK